MDPQTGAIILTAFSACGAVLAAGAAWKAADATRKTGEAQIYLHFLDEYGAPEMRDDLRILRTWYEQQGEQFAQKWVNALQERDPEANRVDLARRHVTFYFCKALSLLDAGVLSLPVVRNITSVSGIEIWYSIAQGLEAALNPMYDRTPFKRLRKIRDAELANTKSIIAIPPMADQQ